MALILAVDPDRSQGAALECVGRELIGHQFVQTPSCADAPGLLGGRVPDLALLPSLLPAQEEDDLRSYLRRLAGADVRTLTIPLLAGPGSSSADGCEPRVFADQIREYLIVEQCASASPDEYEPPTASAPTPHEPVAAPPNRRQRVISAAYTAASWARARRATWAGEYIAAAPPVTMTPARQASLPPAFVPSPMPPAPVFAAVPHLVGAVDTAGVVESIGVLEPIEVVEPIRALESNGAVATPPAVEHAPAHVDAPSEPRDAVWRVAAARIVALLQSLRAPAARSLRIVIVGVILVGAGFASRPYWKSAGAAVTSIASWKNPAATTRPGTVVFESVPQGSQVAVDGRDIGTTPFTAELPSGPHTVEFRSRNRNRTMPFALPAGGRLVERVDWSRRPAGQLKVTSEPAGARILVDGQPRGATPMTIPDLAAGEHAVALESASGSVRRVVNIQAGETTEMAESIFAGWLVVFSPFDVTVTEGSREIRLDDRHEALLPPGPHELHVRNRALGFDEVRRVELKPGEKETVSIALPHSTLSITATESADVWVDGARVGDTPLTDWSTTLGAHEVVLKRAGRDDRRINVTVTTMPVTINVDFAK
jgi:hypothetical protein